MRVYKAKTFSHKDGGKVAVRFMDSGIVVYVDRRGNAHEFGTWEKDGEGYFMYRPFSQFYLKPYPYYRFEDFAIGAARCASMYYNS